MNAQRVELKGSRGEKVKGSVCLPLPFTFSPLLPGGLACIQTFRTK